MDQGDGRRASQSPARGTSNHQAGTSQLESTCIRPDSKVKVIKMGRVRQRRSWRAWGLAAEGPWGAKATQSSSPIVGNSRSSWVSRNRGGPERL
jgi:hypothetical protein